MQTTAAASATEPISSHRSAIELAGVRRAFKGRAGMVTALEGLDLEVAPGEVGAVGRNAPARGLPPDAAARPPGAAAGRALRGPRRPHEGIDAAVARGRAGR